MKVLSSSEFRPIFASLTEPTEVNANGRYIGTWLPADPQRQRVDEPIHPTPKEALAFVAALETKPPTINVIPTEPKPTVFSSSRAAQAQRDEWLRGVVKK